MIQMLPTARWRNTIKLNFFFFPFLMAFFQPTDNIDRKENCNGELFCLLAFVVLLLWIVERKKHHLIQIILILKHLKSNEAHQVPLWFCNLLVSENCNKEYETFLSLWWMSFWTCNFHDDILWYKNHLSNAITLSRSNQVQSDAIHHYFSVTNESNL